MGNRNENMLKPDKVVEHIKTQIKTGNLPINSALPSINQVAREFNMANETVVKAYKRLKEKGIINSIRGKGFFVTKDDFDEDYNVFVMFDTFSAYKETLYNAMINRFGNKARIEIFFHHYNPQVIETLLIQAAGHYTHFILVPYAKGNILPILKSIPPQKLFLLDAKPDGIESNGIYQDFEQDVQDALATVSYAGTKYKRFVYLYKDELTPLRDKFAMGLSAFCSRHKIEFSMDEGSNIKEPKPGEAYFVFEDDHLVNLVIKASAQSLKLGTEVGIISYNETALKKIAAGGISVISTDFAKMGHDIAEMVLNHQTGFRKNPCRFIDRGSF